MRITLNHIYSRTCKKKLTKIQHQLDIDEEVLLVRLSQGDRTAFWQLWIRYQQHIYYRCHTWMRNDYDHTEYAFNRVMFKTWSQLPSVADKITNLQVWLSRVINNACIEIRLERQRIAQCIDSLEFDDEKESVEPEYLIPQPSQAAIASSEWEKYIYLALERLSSQDS
jgi:RNA polymerase sigma-70 factor (ECF subfamily)